MGNICVCGVAKRETERASSPVGPALVRASCPAGPPGTASYIPTPTWTCASLDLLLSTPGSRSTNGSVGSRKSIGTVDTDELASIETLQDACVAAAVKHFADLTSAQLHALPRDLMQRVMDSLVAQGLCTLSKLCQGDKLDLDSLDLSLETYTREVNDGWLLALGDGSPRLRALNLSCCTRVTDAGVRSLSCGTPDLQLLNLRHCVQVSDGGLHHLSTLHKLKVLDLQACENITGMGLVSLTHLSSLHTLNLAQCGRVKGKLHTIAALPSLTHLDIGWCHTLDDVEVVRLACATGLRSLALSYTKVTDVAVSALCGLTALTALDLQGTDLTDAACKTLALFTGLESLHLGHCGYVGDAGIADLTSKLHRLRSLDLSYTGVTNDGVTSLRELTLLTNLSLDSCAVSDIGGKRLCTLKLLERLNLSDTDVRDTTLACLGTLKSLRRLQLANTKITDEGLTHLTTLTQLVELNADVATVTSKGMHALGQCTSLVSLDLYSARVCDRGAAKLVTLKNLQRLELCGGKLTDLGCGSLAKLTNISWLSLSQNVRVTDSGVCMLVAGLTSLEVLNLAHTGVKGSSLRELASLKGLRDLSLRATHVPASFVNTLRDKRGSVLNIKHSTV